MKVASLVLRICALVLLVVAIALLFLPVSATRREEMWGVSYGQRVDLDTDYNSFHVSNYFKVIDRVDGYGYDVFWNVAHVILLVLALGVVVASFFVKFFRKFFFAAVTLALIVVVFLAVDRLDTRFVITGPKYLGSLYGYKIYTETNIKFYFEYVTGIIFISAAFLTQFLSGLFYQIAAKKEKLAMAAAAANVEAEACEEATENVVEKCAEINAADTTEECNNVQAEESGKGEITTESEAQ